MKVYTILVAQYRMFMKMRRVGFLILLLIPMIGSSQIKSTYSYRFGAQIAFGLSKITNNNVGIGGLAGAEHRFSRTLQQK
ncbi:hypothetical protein [Paraflavitalea speifideaquila]|uniref:hypothetical protein n=1 Tax=Paraflavitalea speifideaquila TaxID=3076558 RepID=UPI0028F0B829|nr:hypothetical protein [Paraflavitalea speifideiaquila]